ncbi:hypothetical protein CC2G_007629 [Coprinopsis cinerea AmutBmut pab1-1]|nr:hypothetical protein CC2G_007629 [Coprinopsis cinerea AmutBmut pab1-1]
MLILSLESISPPSLPLEISLSSSFTRCFISPQPDRNHIPHVVTPDKVPLSSHSSKSVSLFPFIVFKLSNPNLAVSQAPVGLPPTGLDRGWLPADMILSVGWSNRIWRRHCRFTVAREMGI